MRFPVQKAEVLVTFIAPVGLLNRDLVAAGDALHHFCHFRAPKDEFLETTTIYHKEVELRCIDGLAQQFAQIERSKNAPIATPNIDVML